MGMDLCLGNLLKVGRMLAGMSDAHVSALYDDEPEGNLTMMARMSALSNRDWYVSGSPRLVFDEKLAAAMMLTDGTPETLGDIRSPFDTFLLHFPDTLITTKVDGRTIAVCNVLVRMHEGAVVAHMGDHSGLYVSIALPSLAECGAFTSEQRAGELVSRLIVGACIEATKRRVSLAAPNRCAKYNGCGVSRGIHRPARVMEFTMTRPVKVDCRQAVRDYAASRDRGLPTSMQTLVRGHWKHQACGRGYSERKLIFVEPYFRGDPEAPTAVRPLEFEAPA